MSLAYKYTCTYTYPHILGLHITLSYPEGSIHTHTKYKNTCIAQAYHTELHRIIPFTAHTELHRIIPFTADRQDSECVQNI